MNMVPDSPVVQEESPAEENLGLRQGQERKPEFLSLSGLPIAGLYTRDDLKDWDPDRDLGTPGDFPYTRGIHPTM